MDASVARLGTYIDVLQIHRLDRSTPREEIMRALNDVVESGKVRYLGASSMAAWEFQTLQNIAERRGWHKFVSMQNYYNLLYREEEREMVGLCLAEGVGMIPWSPLARGRLTRAPDTSTGRAESDVFGKTLYNGFETSDRSIIDRVGQIAERRGLPRAQVALAWLLSKPGVTAPIVGASKPAHLDDAVAALGLVLTADEIASLEQPYVPHAVAGFK